MESLLIDINEEIFSISDELARSYNFDKSHSTLAEKAQDFNNRKKSLMNKVRSQIDTNPAVKVIRRAFKIEQFSPQQKEY